MIFRIVSSAHKDTRRWFHPGLQPKRFFDKAHEWAQQEWENKIKPEILEGLQQDLRR